MRKVKTIKTTTELSHEVAAMLGDGVAVNEVSRFKSMDLCKSIMDTHDSLHEANSNRMALISWVVKIQKKFQGD